MDKIIPIFECAAFAFALSFIPALFIPLIFCGGFSKSKSKCTDSIFPDYFICVIYFISFAILTIIMWEKQNLSSLTQNTIFAAACSVMLCGSIHILSLQHKIESLEHTIRNNAENENRRKAFHKESDNIEEQTKEAKYLLDSYIQLLDKANRLYLNSHISCSVKTRDFPDNVKANIENYEKRCFGEIMSVTRTKYHSYLERWHAMDNVSKKLSEIEQELIAAKDEYAQTLKERITQFDKTITQAEKRKLDLLENELSSHIKGIPYLAGIIAEFDTRGIELLAQQLDWGNNQERKKKVASIREIRKQAQEEIAKCKEAQYQLEYAIRMYPELEDFLDTDYRSIAKIDFSELANENHDRVRNYLSNDEYQNLTSTERNQLALDRYRESHRKANWQIGRDYELYIGHKYEMKGYKVEYYGSQKRLEDLGRDLIAKKDGKTLIIQCKYWSKKKTIHEKHIAQLFGTMKEYCFENNMPEETVAGLLVTNTGISETARKFSEYLNIKIADNIPLNDYPCIKCNINRSADGEITKIYHLPFDQQYDACIIDAPGEFMAMTVAEAEHAGFRRAFRWHSGTE